jgi:rfaE bifunctional protein nucleotidyltransferase chain/domain
MACKNILAIEQAYELVSQLQQQGRRVVLAYGCFDLLHPGHTRYLAAARKLGDILLVALNSDRSALALKGPGRPILPARERAEIVAALEAVDYVTIVDGPSPAALISRMRPRLVAQASDGSSLEGLNPAQVEAAGTEVVRLPLIPGYSTSSLIETAVRNLG